MHPHESQIFTIPYNNKEFTIKVTRIPPSKSPARKHDFKGQKLKHLFPFKQFKEPTKTTSTPPDETKKKKRWWYGSHEYDPEKSSSSKEIVDFLTSSIYTLQVDGRFCMIKNGEMFLRKEVKLKKNKEGKLDSSKIPSDWIPCQDEATNHLVIPYLRPVTDDDKWEKYALERSNNPENGTYEIIGSKFMGNPYGLKDKAYLSPHGTVIFEIPDELKTFDGIKRILEVLNIEGFVLYNTKTGEVRKILRDGFSMEFPDKKKEMLVLPDILENDMKFLGPQRQFKEIPSKVKSNEKSTSITVLTFNVLAPSLVKRNAYNYSSKKALEWDYRSVNLILELKSVGLADVMMFQEVNFYDEFWKPELEKLGYDSVYKSNDVNEFSHGCAIFYKSERLKLIKHKEIDFNDIAKEENDRILLKNNVALLALLEIKQNSKRFIAACTHLYWKPGHSYVRFRQFVRLLDEIRMFEKAPYIICGDFNSSPNEILYKYITSENREQLVSCDSFKELFEIVPYSEKDQKSTEQETKMRKEKVLKIFSRKDIPVLHSVYSDYTSVFPSQSSKKWKGEPPFTHYVEKFQGTLDYILIEKNSVFTPRKLLEIPPEDSVKEQTALPSDVYSSDHLPLKCELELES